MISGMVWSPSELHSFACCDVNGRLRTRIRRQVIYHRPIIPILCTDLFKSFYSKEFRRLYLIWTGTNEFKFICEKKKVRIREAKKNSQWISRTIWKTDMVSPFSYGFGHSADPASLTHNSSWQGVNSIELFYFSINFTFLIDFRHPSNLMLDRMSGKILHIDFGDCFEVSYDIKNIFCFSFFCFCFCFLFFWQNGL